MAVGTHQGVAGLAPRPFTLEEETGSHHVFMDIAPALHPFANTARHNGDTTEQERPRAAATGLCSICEPHGLLWLDGTDALHEGRDARLR